MKQLPFISCSCRFNLIFSVIASAKLPLSNSYKKQCYYYQKRLHQRLQLCCCSIVSGTRQTFQPCLVQLKLVDRFHYHYSSMISITTWIITVIICHSYYQMCKVISTGLLNHQYLTRLLKLGDNLVSEPFLLKAISSLCLFSNIGWLIG